jgi:hypothetical protein
MSYYKLYGIIDNSHYLSHTEPIQHYFLNANDPLSPVVSPITSKSGPTTRRASSERTDVYGFSKIKYRSIWDEFAILLREMWTSSLLAISPNSFLDSIWKIVPMVIAL